MWKCNRWKPLRRQFIHLWISLRKRSVRLKLSTRIDAIKPDLDTRCPALAIPIPKHILPSMQFRFRQLVGRPKPSVKSCILLLQLVMLMKVQCGLSTPNITYIKTGLGEKITIYETPSNKLLRPLNMTEVGLGQDLGDSDQDLCKPNQEFF